MSQWLYRHRLPGLLAAILCWELPHRVMLGAIFSISLSR